MLQPAHIVRRLYNAPLALHPRHAPMALQAALSLPDSPPMEAAYAGQAKPYGVIQGVAIVPVQGVLIHRLGCPVPWCGMSGYDGIRAAVMQAVADAGIRAIALHIDSPGGECSGLFDLADTILRARASKPIWACLDEDAFSAAYAIASACNRVCVPRSGGTGSIGVLAIFPDISAALKTAGIKMHVFQFGARKADGFAELPMAPAARDRFQADVDALGKLFVATVARNRGLSAAAIIAQEATTFMGAEGVSAGLADMVAPPDEALNALLAELEAGKAAQLRASR